MSFAFVQPISMRDAPCRERIADYKAPDRLVLVDAFPVNATHKVDKAALAAQIDTTEQR